MSGTLNTPGHDLVRINRDLVQLGDDHRAREAAGLADELVATPGDGWLSARTIQLPAADVGQVYEWRPKKWQREGNDPWQERGSYLGRAAGQLEIRANIAVELYLTRLDDDVMEALCRLDAGSVQAIYVSSSAGPVPDGCLRSVAHLTDLRKLVIRKALVDLRHLRRLRFLRHLDLGDCTGFDDDSFTHLAAASDLRYLMLSRVDASAVAFTRMPHFASLEVLRVTGTKIDDRGIKRLVQRNQLRELALSGTDVVSTGEIAARAVPRLEVLELKGLPVEDESIAQLVAGDRLRTVDLRDTAIGDATLKRLASHPALDSLLLDGCPNITDIGLRAISKLRYLNMLWVGYTGITGSSFASIARMPMLTNLNISGLPATDEQFRSLQGLKRMSGLWAYDIAVGDRDAARVIRAMPELWGLGLSGARIGQSFARALVGHAELGSLSVLRTSVSTVLASSIAKCTTLRSLDLTGCNLSDPKGSLLRRLTNLRELRLAGNPDLGTRTATALGRMRHLERLDLRGTFVEDADLAPAVSQMPALEQLCIEETPAGDATLAALAGNSKLRELNAGGTLITDDGLAHLVSCSSLEHLNIQGTVVSDRGLQYLAKLGDSFDIDALADQFGLFAQNPGAAAANAIGEGASESLRGELIHFERAGVPAALRADRVMQRLGIDLPTGSLSRLRTIDLRRTDITDAGLEHLASHRLLGQIDVRQCRDVSQSGVQRLETRLPECWCRAS